MNGDAGSLGAGGLVVANGERTGVVGQNRTLWFVGLSILAFALKVYMALLTFGTNDVVTFFQFAGKLSTHGLAWTYQHDISFNHPPLTAYYLCLIHKLD